MLYIQIWYEIIKNKAFFKVLVIILFNYTLIFL